jgi:Domain of unknown function (DUF1876)
MHDSIPPKVDATHQTMTITINESGGRTQAKVELHSAGGYLAATGVAYRHPADQLNDDARLKTATARALSDLADRLVAQSTRSSRGQLTVVR